MYEEFDAPTTFKVLVWIALFGLAVFLIFVFPVLNGPGAADLTPGEWEELHFPKGAAG